MRTGQCDCGAIRYRFEGEPLFTHACHCTDCQRRSGAAFCLSTFVEEWQLSVTAGELASCPLQRSSGKTKQIYYCDSCATMLYGRAPQTPKLYWLRPGTLHDTSWLYVQAHIWTKSKQRWIVLPCDIPLFAQGYAFADIWPDASLQRLALL